MMEISGAGEVRIGNGTVTRVSLADPTKYGVRRLTRAEIESWLLRYAWLGTAADQASTVTCIMAQDGWEYIDAVADSFAGAQSEPGLVAYSEGTQYALSALYECHAGPHLASCAMHRDGNAND